MAKQPFMPRTDDTKQSWLQNFASKLPSYATKYGITTDEVTDMQIGSAYFSYWLNYQNQFDEYNRKVTGFKNELRDGLQNGGSGSLPPVAPDVPGAPDSVPQGLFKRAAALANRIKGNINYTVTDGNDLGLEGAQIDEPDETVKPAIRVRMASGGHPEIVWKKSNVDALEIRVDRGNGQWQFLAIDSVPNYVDTFLLPAQNTSATWKYMCIYRRKDEQVGQWSDVVSVTVAGGVPV